MCHETGRSVDPGASTVVILREEVQGIWGNGTPNCDYLWANKKNGICCSLLIDFLFIYTNVRVILACFTVERFLEVRLVALVGLAGLPPELENFSHTTRALPGNSSWTGIQAFQFFYLMYTCDWYFRCPFHLSVMNLRSQDSDRGQSFKNSEFVLQTPIYINQVTWWVFFDAAGISIPQTYSNGP